ncbi:unnamed protein product [Adineta ricciae]|uniref:Uncharacterized protein n=1 Tax=Adineta ricciae TaxID=249248 RepID=A0A813STG4_ADIRI|nr:unnamed protein product [Adineta ricciae]
MMEENLIPPSEHPVRIRWLNAVEQHPAIPKPVAQHPQTPAIKMNKMTAPSGISKARTKVASATNVVRFSDQSATVKSVDMSIQSSKGLKELSAEDKLKIANLIKELARVGHEKELIEDKLEQERKQFEVQMKALLTDYDKLMKDNQSNPITARFRPYFQAFDLELLTRYNETKAVLTDFEKKSQLSSRTYEFPNPQRSSTPIDILSVKEQPTTRSDTVPPTRTANAILTEQFHLKQLMMEKQLTLLHKQQQILEKELQQRNANSSLEQAVKPIQTVTRSTSPLKYEPKVDVAERATSPVKQTKSVVKATERQISRPIQTQRATLDTNDEDLLILSLNESLHEQLPKTVPPTMKSRVHSNPPTNLFADSEEQNLLKDIFFIC